MIIYFFYSMKYARFINSIEVSKILNCFSYTASFISITSFSITHTMYLLSFQLPYSIKYIVQLKLQQHCIYIYKKKNVINISIKFGQTSNQPKFSSFSLSII